jgi:hypothetical protein
MEVQAEPVNSADLPWAGNPQFTRKEACDARREGHPPINADVAKDFALRVLRGDTNAQISAATGYALSYVPKVKKSDAVKRSMQQIMRNEGLDEKVLVGKVKDLLNAKNTIYATSRGEITDTREVPDNTNQRETVAMAADWLGVSPFRKIQQEGGGGPRLVINVNPVFAQAIFGNGTHHGDSDRYPGGVTVDAVQAGSDGSEDPGKPEAHDSD